VSDSKILKNVSPSEEEWNPPVSIGTLSPITAELRHTPAGRNDNFIFFGIVEYYRAIWLSLVAHQFLETAWPVRKRSTATRTFQCQV
jgi:hypothetical protein